MLLPACAEQRRSPRLEADAVNMQLAEEQLAKKVHTRAITNGSLEGTSDTNPTFEEASHRREEMPISREAGM